MDGKICSKCGEFKSYSDFNKHKDSKDGYGYYCKQCMKDYRKQYYQSNKEEINEKINNMLILIKKRLKITKNNINKIIKKK